LDTIPIEYPSRLADLESVDLPPSVGAVVISLTGLSDSPDLRIRPESALLYYPMISPGREAPARLFAEAEKREFLDLRQHLTESSHSLNVWLGPRGYDGPGRF